MHQKLFYEPIISNVSEWPVVKMYQNKAHFLAEVSKMATKEILATQADPELLSKELAKTLVNDQMRIKRSPWRVDPKDDATFWNQKIETFNQIDLPLTPHIQEITLRYAKEIAGDFKLLHYRLAQATAGYTLNRLLNPMKPRRPQGLKKINSTLHEQIHITGAVQELRELSRQGTIVMVPTHYSHFDSVLIWWVINALGLPSFIYGAGLNLFNHQFFGYFMNKLGTYKVDRRKKNFAYLTTLKTYSSLALHWGCHNLFYPSGTRSRSGTIETNLKFGLLSTAFEAQKLNFETANGTKARKIFIVPVTLNYHFVLEAPFLIRNYLFNQDLYSYEKPAKDWLNHSYKLLKLIKNFATKSSSITVVIAPPMDVLGNQITKSGESYDNVKNKIDLEAYFNELNHKTPDVCDQIAKEHVRTLAKNIGFAYKRHNCILSSTLLAFVAFQLMLKKHSGLSLKEFFDLPVNLFTIPYELAEKTFNQIRSMLLAMEKRGEIVTETVLKSGKVSDMVLHGLNNLGLYHDQLPLLKNKVGELVTRDIYSLLYYHNRLTGYGLEAYIK